MNQEGEIMTDEKKKKISELKITKIHNWINNGDHSIGGILPEHEREKLRKDHRNLVIMPKPSTEEKPSRTYDALMVLLEGKIWQSGHCHPQIIHTLRKTCNWKIYNLTHKKMGQYQLDKEQLRKYREGELVVFKSNIKIPQYAPDTTGEYQGASHLYEGADKLNKAKNKGEIN